jgi:Cu/Ag efflux protein CusF
MSNAANQLPNLVEGRVARLVLLVLALALSNLAASAAPQLPSTPTGPVANPKAAVNPGEPCCSITSINVVTGVVTAKVNSAGQIFQFKVTDAGLLRSLKVGQGVFASFQTQKVSVDGIQPCCAIVSVGKLGGTGRAAVGQNLGNQVNPGEPCCEITNIQFGPVDGLVTAKVNSTGQSFQFKVTDTALLNSMKVGQGIFANLKTQKVSVDGATPCCQIVSKGQAPSVHQAANVPPGTKGVSLAGQGAKVQPLVLPKLAFGTPQAVKAGASKQPLGVSQYMRLAPAGNATLVHLHGLDGIKQATGLPQGVQDFLFLHAQKLPPGEVDNYIVNVQLAQDWFQKHPEPDFVKQAAADAMGGGDSHAGCDVISTHCLGEAAQHVEYEAKRQEQNFINAAQQEWDHITGQAGQLWGQVEGCFADHSLDPANSSFALSLDPQFPFSFQQSGQTKNNFGSASGKIQGNATLGVPLNGNFNAQLVVSYVPCLPFMIRPKDIASDGTLGVGATLNATLNTSGQFQQAFTVPPGGIKIPVYAIPVVIGGAPIAEVDVSVYLEGNVSADGNGSLNGTVNLQAHEETAYQFNCDGHGCNASAHRVPVPDTATESVQVQGRIHLRPAVYAAVQLDLDFDLLSARAGPEPYLYGEIYGCAAASGSQSTGGASTSQEYNALTADVDWGMDLRAEAFAGTDKIGEKKWRLTGGHLLFKDLAHSNALIPALAGTTQPPLGQPAAYNVKMPACYPYTDQMEYQVAWTGGATATGLAPPANPTPSPNKFQQLSAAALVVKGLQAGTGDPPPTCTLQSGQAECWTDPLKDMPFSLAWPAAGSYNLTITPMQDKHGRKFDSSTAAQTNISVQQPAAGSSPQ